MISGDNLLRLLAQPVRYPRHPVPGYRPVDQNPGEDSVLPGRSLLPGHTAPLIGRDQILEVVGEF